MLKLNFRWETIFPVHKKLTDEDLKKRLFATALYKMVEESLGDSLPTSSTTLYRSGRDYLQARFQTNKVDKLLTDLEKENEQIKKQAGQYPLEQALQECIRNAELEKVEL
jgi:hypothetical protein